jgi:ribulose-bisphosphate carboxylase large chain
MRVIAKISRVIGVDQLHVGTVVGKMFESKKDVLSNCDALRSEFYGIKRTLPVASGGLHPGMIPKLVKIFGNDVVLQFGGGCHGHPKGTRAGATAIRQSLDAVTRQIPLKEYAKERKELMEALKKWG